MVITVEIFQSEAESHVLSFLIEVMRKLNADPGAFESYQKELNSLYLEYAHSEFVMSNAIEIIFEQVRYYYYNWKTLCTQQACL